MSVIFRYPVNLTSLTKRNGIFSSKQKNNFRLIGTFQNLRKVYIRAKKIEVISFNMITLGTVILDKDIELETW